MRGEFKPIKTNVPGIEICEVFPKVASLMDKAAVIRSVVGCSGGHDAYQCLTGWNPNDAEEHWRSSRDRSGRCEMYGPVDPSVPPYHRPGQADQARRLGRIRASRVFLVRPMHHSSRTARACRT